MTTGSPVPVAAPGGQQPGAPPPVTSAGDDELTRLRTEVADLRAQLGRGAAAARRGGPSGARWAPGFIANHLDPVRIAGLVVAVILALTLSSWTALLVIALLLAAYESGVTMLARHHKTQMPV